ncbi:unnamed protein product [Clavelina lepadiformis]|uniref:Uncharacterized protein n=1 Tax=Clavelina lepadiformis TaxID=159417 RepID=A0ABP0GLD5_CLALP
MTYTNNEKNILHHYIDFTNRISKHYYGIDKLETRDLVKEDLWQHSTVQQQQSLNTEYDGKKESCRYEY